MDDQRQIAERFPDMSGETAQRLDRVHAAIGDQPEEIDTAELLAKRDALLALVEQAA